MAPSILFNGRATVSTAAAAARTPTAAASATAGVAVTAIRAAATPAATVEPRLKGSLINFSYQDVVEESLTATHPSELRKLVDREDSIFSFSGWVFARAKNELTPIEAAVLRNLLLKLSAELQGKILRAHFSATSVAVRQETISADDCKLMLPSIKDFLSHFLLEISASLDRDRLAPILRHIAIRDGVAIEGWDREWGLYHIQEDTAASSWQLRLAKGIHIYELQRRCDFIKETLASLSTHCPKEIVARLLQGSDNEEVKKLLRGERRDLPEDVFAELHWRATVLGCMSRAFESLLEKYPPLEIHRRSLCAIVQKVVSTPLGSRLAGHFYRSIQNVTDVLSGLHAGAYAVESASKIVSSLLAGHNSIEKELLRSTMALRKMGDGVFEELRTGAIARCSESTYRDVFFKEAMIEGSLLKAKVKPLPLSTCRNEINALNIDSIFGLGMTAPSIMLVDQKIRTLQTLLCHLRSSKPVQIELGLRALGMLPAALQHELHGQAYKLFGEERMEDGLGKTLWESNLSIGNRIAILQSLLDLQKGISLQLWIPEPSVRAFDMIKNDPRAGEQIKRMPKEMVHMYTLLAMLKGSQDCSSGNTMFVFDRDGSTIRDIVDFDDELSFPDSNDYNVLRCWQLGLPQSQLPIDKALMLLFLSPSISEKFEVFLKMAAMRPAAKDALRQRWEKIKALFTHQVALAAPSLTPMDLFFALFGGREEYTEIVAEQARRGEAPHPWEIFEYKLGNAARRFPDWGEEHWPTVKANFTALYS